MIVSVSSGKGGAGKTLLSTSLALSYDGEIEIVDCDVEEPDVHLYLKPDIEREESVYVEVPELIKERCTGCHKCAEICEYNAIMKLKGSVLIFEDLCHSCGGCFLVCPENALKRKKKEIGKISMGKVNERVKFMEGRLNIGGTLTTHLIKEVLKKVDSEMVIIDGPPGSSCPSLAVMEKSDFILFVAEASPYGISDFKRVVEMVPGTKNWGVIINKVFKGDDLSHLEAFCDEKGIQILLKVPFDMNIAKESSKGKSLVEIDEGYRIEFLNVWKKIVGGNNGK